MPPWTIIRRGGWGALEPRGQRSSIGDIHRITVHRSETPDDDIEKGVDGAARVRSIQTHHMETMGFSDIGYHLLIDREGRFYQGRLITERGAHAKRHNLGNIGICVIGTEHFAEVQRKQLEFALCCLCDSLILPMSAVCCHSDLCDTDCPGNTIRGWVTAWRKMVISLTPTSEGEIHEASTVDPE